MPNHHRSPLLVRTAVVAGTTMAAAIVGVLPATPAVAAPAATPVVTVAHAGSLAPASARASALANAMSKIGSPYRWGATGPNAFDCSGLVQWAFKRAGIALPRTSRAMSQVGTPVAKSDLQPGDLVFSYRPVSHVSIYIGNGKVVHASNKKDPVKISDLSRMTFTTARRV